MPDNDKFIYALFRPFSLLCYLRKKKEHLNTGEKIKNSNTRIKKWNTFVSHFFIYIVFLNDLAAMNANAAQFYSFEGHLYIYSRGFLCGYLLGDEYEL